MKLRVGIGVACIIGDTGVGIRATVTTQFWRGAGVGKSLVRHTSRFVSARITPVFSILDIVKNPHTHIMSSTVRGTAASKISPKIP